MGSVAIFRKVCVAALQPRTAFPVFEPLGPFGAAPVVRCRSHALALM